MSLRLIQPTGNLARFFIELITNFSGNDDTFAPLTQRLSEDALAMPRSVDTSRIKNGDAKIQCTLDSANGFVIIYIPISKRQISSPERSPNRPAAHPQCAHFCSASPQRPCYIDIHSCFSLQKAVFITAFRHAQIIL